VRELEVDLDGPVHYADHGGHGRPIVLVHGLGGSRLNWLAVAPGLAQDHRVFALDLIGHGLTPRAGRKATLANHRRLIDGFIEKIAGEPAVLVGNSTGGHLSILEAALRPENVAGLILVDPAVPIPVRGSRPSPASLVLAPLLVRGLGGGADDGRRPPDDVGAGGLPDVEVGVAGLLADPGGGDPGPSRGPARTARKPGRPRRPAPDRALPPDLQPAPSELLRQGFAR